MQYSVFICHAYRHSDIYNRLRALLLGASRFTLRNESIPDDMLLEFKGTDELRSAIRARIARSDVVLVLTKPVAQRSTWLREEIAIARELGKPIIAITHKAHDRKSAFVMGSADRHVDTWRADAVVHAIREVVGARKERDRRKKAGAPPALPASAPLPSEEFQSEPAAVAERVEPPATKSEIPKIEPQLPKEVILQSIRAVPAGQPRAAPLPALPRLWRW
jgi:Thoeris protein ThsB, TIR-like domain